MLILAGSASAGDDWNGISVSDSVVSFGAVSTGESHSTSVTITNNLAESVSITAFGFTEDVFLASFSTPATIDPSGTKEIYIYFMSEQNVSYTDFLRIEFDRGVRPIIVEVSAEGDHPGTYYDCTQNKWAEELKTVLTNLIDNHNSLGYTTARDQMYGSIDNDDTCIECPTTGCVECIYTGRIGCFNTRAGANANSFNCEHTWPQSFSSEMEPMKSDLFHLYPSDVTANGKRANLDFGMVTSTTWTQGGSRLGTDSTGQTVFEPRDAHKGNVARTHFYYIIRYDGNYVGYSNPAKMETHFRNWHISDPVDSAEEQRNDDIYALQYNRNPFIDHPAMADRISSFFGTAVRETFPEIVVSPLEVDMGTIGFDSTVIYHIAIINTGSDVLDVTSISSTNPDFTVSETGLVLSSNTYDYVRVEYSSADVELADSTSVLISSDDPDDGLLEVSFAVQVSDLSGIQDPAPCEITLFQNYPNPFGLETTIDFHMDRPGPVTLRLYNVEGQSVRHLLKDYAMPGGDHRVQFSAGDLPAGVYFYRLESQGSVRTRRMLLLRRN
jgi:endonuclease I